jgi:hypothetical protein
VVTIRAIVLFVLIFILILIFLIYLIKFIGFILILVFIILIHGCLSLILFRLFLFGFLLSFSSQATNQVFLDQDIGHGKLGLSGVLLANPVILTSHATGKLVELRAILDEIRRRSTNESRSNEGGLAALCFSRGWSRRNGDRMCHAPLGSGGLKRLGRSLVRRRWAGRACELDAGSLWCIIFCHRRLEHGSRRGGCCRSSLWLSLRLSGTSKLDASLSRSFLDRLLNYSSSAEEVAKEAALLLAGTVETKHRQVGERRAGGVCS